MALLCTAPPLLEPVQLSELKLMLRVDSGDTTQDDVINGLALAARGWCETVTQRRFVQQTWQLSQDYFPGYIDSKIAGSRISSPFVSGANALLVGIRYAFQLPFPPVQTLNSFTYQDANGGLTSMVQGPFNISSVSNVTGQPVVVTTSTAHNLITNAGVTFANNANLLTLLAGNPNQTVIVLTPTTFSIQYVVGTGTTITGTGTVTGYNFVLDLLSQPARLTPVFGTVWPVARVTTNAVQLSYTLGYASVISVTTTASSATLGTATFTSANVGQPVYIPGAGVSGGSLNTIIQSVSGGVPTLRDLPSTTISSPVSALLVNFGTPVHFELVRTAIKFLVSNWFVRRLPSFDKDIRESLEAILSPCMDKRA